MGIEAEQGDSGFKSLVLFSGFMPTCCNTFEGMMVKPLRLSMSAEIVPSCSVNMRGSFVKAPEMTSCDAHGISPLMSVG